MLLVKLSVCPFSDCISANFHQLWLLFSWSCHYSRQPQFFQFYPTHECLKKKKKIMSEKHKIMNNSNVSTNDRNVDTNSNQCIYQQQQCLYSIYCWGPQHVTESSGRDLDSGICIKIFVIVKWQWCVLLFYSQWSHFHNNTSDSSNDMSTTMFL